ncbi:hypothetical protein [Paenibacillus sp. JJ-223]|uniref:hypothetical protein n=1 Tax=Paenibacillus sp. JJ-223 TaxID=2905647 RepID=UPI001F1DCF05|nr:hypothetical protein [Paenibacillus sp. JJ-223]
MDESIYPEQSESGDYSTEIGYEQNCKTQLVENEYNSLEQLVDLIGQSTSMSMYVNVALEQDFPQLEG